MLSEMKAIIGFTLEKFGVKAKWQIVPLNFQEWKKFSIDRTRLDKSAQEQEKQIKKMMMTIKEPLDEESKDTIHKLFEMEKDIKKEYGRVLTLEERLRCSASSLLFPHELIKKLRRLRSEEKLPFYYKLLHKNMDVDHLIVLNSKLTSKDSRREQLKTAVHETLHFIQRLNKEKMTYESIESKTDRIVDEFLLSQKKP